MAFDMTPDGVVCAECPEEELGSGAGNPPRARAGSPHAVWHAPVPARGHPRDPKLYAALRESHRLDTVGEVELEEVGRMRLFALRGRTES